MIEEAREDELVVMLVPNVSALAANDEELVITVELNEVMLEAREEEALTMEPL